jgi:hypothetical protein
MMSKVVFAITCVTSLASLKEVVTMIEKVLRWLVVEDDFVVGNCKLGVKLVCG